LTAHQLIIIIISHAQKKRTPANRLTDLTKSIARLLSIKVFHQSRMPMKNVIAAEHRRTSLVIDGPAAWRPLSEASETEVLLATQAEWAHTSVASLALAQHYNALPAVPSNGLCAPPILKSCEPLSLVGLSPSSEPQPGRRERRLGRETYRTHQAN
jgi:hypothetical protein